MANFFEKLIRFNVQTAAIIPGPWQAPAQVLLLIDSANQARKAKAAANAAARAAQFEERQQATRSANDAGRIIYGRDIVAGSLRYWQTTGTKGEFLHLVYVFAAHECNAVEKVYFNDIELPAPDGAGLIQSGSFAEVKTSEHVRGSRVGAGTITLASIPTSIAQVTRSVGTGDSLVVDIITTGYSWTAGSAVVTITDSTAGATFEVDAIYTQSTPRVKYQVKTGAAGQTAFADLVTDSAGKWTAAHKMQGCCAIYLRIEYTPEMFGQIGIPEIKAQIRGHKIADPRTGTTVWTENSALIQAHYLKTYCGATTAEVPDAMVTTEANNCDQSVTLTVGGATEKRYTCNVSFSTEMTPRDILTTIGETMGSGVPAYAGGQFLIRAGVARTPTLTIANDMIVGPVTIQAATKRARLINRVVVAYPEPTKFGVMTEAPPVTNATYLSEDNGIELPLNLTLEGVNGQVRAQRLGKIALERARQGMRVDMQCSLDAYDALPGDWVSVTLDRYGWTGVNMEVLSRRIDLEQGLVSYSLQEIASGVFDWNYGEATTVDLTPNTSLPNPLAVPAALTLATPVTGTSALQRMSDGTIISRALISWTQSSDVFVLRGGTIETEWLYSGDTVWQAAGSVPGDDVQVYIGPLTDRRTVLVRVRQVNAVGRIGPWAYKAFAVVGKTAAPANVTGLAASVQGGQARITWTPCTDIDYFETEIRVGSSSSTWGTSTTLFRGNAQSAPWSPYPVEGSYLVRAVNYDSTGNASTPVSIAVNVSSVGSIFVGGNVLPNADFTGYTGATTGVADGWVAYTNGASTAPGWARPATGSIDDGPWMYINAATLFGSSVDRVGIATNGNQPLPMPNGGPVVISGHVTHYATSTCIFYGEYKNSSGTVIGSFTKTLPAGAGTWRRYEFFDNAPSGTAYLFFYVWFQGLGTSSTLNAGVDKVSVSPGDSSLPFAPKAGEVYPGQVGTTELADEAATVTVGVSGISGTVPAGSGGAPYGFAQIGGTLFTFISPSNGFLSATIFASVSATGLTASQTFVNGFLGLYDDAGSMITGTIPGYTGMNADGFPIERLPISASGSTVYGNGMGKKVFPVTKGTKYNLRLYVENGTGLNSVVVSGAASIEVIKK